ncbi:MAG TPA: LytR C-terminal domain-containing protein [Patescibacteria group bacterium]|nr:LytR C-terminal domain-containing protein [Patescibacteria group bacterium]
MNDSSNVTRYVKYFILIVIIAALISIGYRVAANIRNSNFKYDTYNILVLSKDSYLVHLDKSAKKITVFKYEGATKFLQNKSRIVQSLLIEVPIDAVIESKNKDLEIDKNFLTFDTFSRLFFNKGDNKLDGVNKTDLLKIYFMSRGVSDNDREESGDKIKNLKDFDNISYNNALYDNSIFDDKTSLQIINATDINGLGTRVSEMLKNMGYNVVSVDTNNDQKSSLKTRSSDTISFRRLWKIFDFPIKPSSSDSIADIILVIAPNNNKLFEGL